MIEWICSFCQWSDDEGNSPNVIVNALNWTASKTDGEFSARTNGSQNVSDQNRVYALPALEAVPSSVMVGWLHDAMGAEQVAAAEANIEAQITEQKTPTSGGFIPDDDGVETLPV